MQFKTWRTRFHAPRSNGSATRPEGGKLWSGYGVPRDFTLRELSGGSPEESFVRTFVHRDRRRRFLALLSSPKGRIRFRETLAHRLELDPSRAHPIPPGKDTAVQIEALLRSLGAPDECYVISESRNLDGQILDLRPALERVVGMGIGTVVYCTPELAYYEAEDASTRFLLRAFPTVPRRP